MNYRRLFLIIMKHFLRTAQHIYQIDFNLQQHRVVRDKRSTGRNENQSIFFILLISPHILRFYFLVVYYWYWILCSNKSPEKDISC
jgi:hypothetical protein